MSAELGFFPTQQEAHANSVKMNFLSYTYLIVAFSLGLTKKLKRKKGKNLKIKSLRKNIPTYITHLGNYSLKKLLLIGIVIITSHNTQNSL